MKMKIFLMDTNANRQLLFVQGGRAKAEPNPAVGGIDINADQAGEKLRQYFADAFGRGVLNSFDDMPGKICPYRDVLAQCQADHDAARLTLLFDGDNPL
jgi:hypothetical protein